MNLTNGCKRRYLLLTLALLTILHPGVSAAGEKITVAVTILPQAYFVERLGGKYVDVRVMIPQGVSPEAYEPTAQQLIAFSRARIYVKIGQEAFPAEKKFLHILSEKSASVKVVGFPKDIKQIQEDPHIWLSPTAVKELAPKICQTLITIDPSNKSYYENNLSQFLKDVEGMVSRIKTILVGKEGRSFLVYHPAWGYFASEFGLKQMAIEKDGKPASALHLRRIVEEAKEKRIDVIFVQRGFDAKGARSVAREIRGRIIEVDPLEKDWLNNLPNFAASLKLAVR
jgi:zinc transport system substrate-binding protein